MVLYMILDATLESQDLMACSMNHAKDSTVVCHLNYLILGLNSESHYPILSCKTLQFNQTSQLISDVKLQCFNNYSFIQFVLLSII